MEHELGIVWIVGAEGRVGKEINQLLDRRKVRVLKTDKDEVDITNQQEVSMYMDMNRPNVIINCAGLTDVAYCEENRDEAFRVNALGARNLSVGARRTKARMVQISTDDVFDGNSKTPYHEFDTPAPVTVYGKSKLAGENFVKEYAPKHIIVRSSWVYGEGENYVNNLLKMADTQKEIQVMESQFACPTSAKELARVIVRLIRLEEDGLFHAVCKGHCSRLEFAKTVLSMAGKTEVALLPTKHPAMEMTMNRPSFCVLDNLMLRISDIEEPCEWKTGLMEYLKDR